MYIYKRVWRWKKPESEVNTVIIETYRILKGDKLYCIILLITFLMLSNPVSAQDERKNNLLPDSSFDEVEKYLNLGVCSEKTLDYEKIIEKYKTVIEKKLSTDINQKVTLESHLGELYFRKKNYDSAITYINLLPVNLEGVTNSRALFYAQRAFFYLAFSYANIGEKQKGKDVLEDQFTKLAGKKDFSNVQYFCDMCIINNLYLDAALYWAKKSVEEYDAYLSEERKKISQISEKIERQKAEENLISLEKNYYWILNTYGELSGLMNNYSDAINAWKKLLELPDCLYAKIFKPQCKAYSAVIYIKSGDTETGERLIKEMQENSDDKSDALFFLPIACARYKVKIKEAITWAEGGLKLRDLMNNYSLYDAYAELLFEDGQVDKAILWETKAYKIMPMYQFKDKIEKYKAALK